MDNTLDKSIEFALNAHSGQKRKSGEDFTNHLLRVKNYLLEIGIKDETILAAAMLHNITKSTKVTNKELQKEFGKKISYLVERLNEISSIKLPLDDDVSKHKNLHKLLFNLSQDMRVLIIRLADRIDNIKTCQDFPLKDQIWIAKKALAIYAPISESIGLHVYYRYFTKEAFRILNPKRYYRIRQHMEKRLENARPTLKALEERLEHIIKTVTNSYKMTSRAKSTYSIHLKAINKAKKGKIEHNEDLGNLFDLLGIRILVNTEKECFETMNKIRENWKEVPGEYDDYITNPKPNGYKTLQTSIKIDSNLTCEIQVRTYEMHEFNEYGHASHYLYKYGTKKDTSTLWMKELIKSKDNIKKQIVADNKIKAFEKEILILTPKQNIIALPKGSCGIDFAYAIHTDIGNFCSQVLINGKPVKLNTELKSGDTVEIKTKKNRLPSLDWLDFVKTQEAKRNIRKYNS